jgi:hypothetical protein
MSGEHDYIYATVLFFAWELVRWQEVIDWAVGIAGAVSLIVLNVIRIHKTIVNNRDVDK